MAQREKAKPKVAKASAKGGRVRKLNRKQSRQKTKKEAASRAKLPGSFRLSAQVLKTIARFWKPLAGILLVYLVLNIIFASGLSGLSSTTNDIKNNLNNGQNSHFIRAIGSFSSLIGTSGSGNSQSGSVLLSILIILESLVIIWALRQLLAGNQISVKQAYYSAMKPLVPFLLVLFVIILQLLPVSLGTAALGIVLSSVFTSQAVITIVFSLLFVVLAAWSAYMLSSSVFALYIVTLPDIQPRQALSSAKTLVRFRRWQLMRKIVWLPVFILIIMGLIVTPLILTATFLAAPAFYLLGILSILFVHTYLYSLYRSML
jgi:hypothetical protein